MNAILEQKKIVIKSAEQKLIERETEKYIAALRHALNAPVQIEVSISGLPITKIASIAHFTDTAIKTNELLPTKPHYTRPCIKGQGFWVVEISE
jgi:hypothetical protein